MIDDWLEGFVINHLGNDQIRNARYDRQNAPRQSNVPSSIQTLNRAEIFNHFRLVFHRFCLKIPDYGNDCDFTKKNNSNNKCKK